MTHRHRAAVSGIAAARRSGEEFRQQGANRLVQCKPAALHALHDRRGRHRLGDRGEREDRCGVYRPVGVRIGRADVARAGHPSVPSDQRRSSRYHRLTDPAFQQAKRAAQRVRVHARRFSPRYINTHAATPSACPAGTCRRPSMHGPRFRRTRCLHRNAAALPPFRLLIERRYWATCRFNCLVRRHGYDLPHPGPVSWQHLLSSSSQQEVQESTRAKNGDLTVGS